VLNFSQAGRDREVLITGTGIVCPLGIGVPAAWQRLLHGPSACRSLSPSELAGGTQLKRVPGLRVYGAPVEQDRVRRLCQQLPGLQRLPVELLSAVLGEPVLAMTTVALEEALQQAGLSCPLNAGERAAVLFGGSKGGLATAELLLSSLRQGTEVAADKAAWSPGNPGDSNFATAFRHAFTTDGAGRLIAGLLEAGGPGQCPVAACATGLISVLQGAALIQAGHCDLCITGSADAALRSSVLASFHRLQVLSRNPDAATACRPFDVTRDGFVIGDGAAVLILESREHAYRRGARPLAQVLSGGWLSDPTGMTQMNDSGTTVAELLRRCCDTAGLTPDVLSLHGTGTETNDLVEARGIIRSLGDRLPLCFATKGATGHLLGAAGSVEMALLTAAMAAGRQPGTKNLRQRDPCCPLPLETGDTPVPADAIWGKLSLGFGGHVACGLFRAESTTVSDGHA